MARCRSCNAPVLWAKTTAGKAIAVDAEPDSDWDQPVIDPSGTLRPTGTSVEGRYGKVPLVEVVGGGQASLDAPAERRWRPHFATCPDAGSWRRG